MNLPLDTRALTLWQPWAWAIAEGYKHVENRPWPPRNVLRPGERFLLHAGRKYDTEQTWADIQELVPVPVPTEDEIALGAFVGVATLDRVVHESERFGLHQPDAALSSPWFCGPYGWVLRDMRALKTPIPWKGALSLWRVPATIIEAINEDLQA